MLFFSVRGRSIVQLASSVHIYGSAAPHVRWTRRAISTDTSGVSGVPPPSPPPRSYAYLIVCLYLIFYTWPASVDAEFHRWRILFRAGKIDLPLNTVQAQRRAQHPMQQLSAATPPPSARCSWYVDRRKKTKRGNDRGSLCTTCTYILRSMLYRPYEKHIQYMTMTLFDRTLLWAVFQQRFGVPPIVLL